MSISANRLTPARRVSFPEIAVAVLVTLALTSVLVAITVANTSSGSTRVYAPSVASPLASGSATRGYFRDPTTHALLRVQPPSPSGTPGPGHK
jgi:hypothetical protein